MSSLTRFSLGQATEKVLTLKKRTGENIIELGVWISSVKENIPYGEFVDWLKYDVKIPWVSAQRFMLVSKNVDAQTIDRIGFRKLTEILELPASEFRNELLEKATEMSRDEIEIAKSTYKKISEKVEEGEEVKVSPEEILSETAMKCNAKLLDTLAQINLNQVVAVYLDFLETQLSGTSQTINSFLEKVKNEKLIRVSSGVEEEEP